MHQAVHSNPKSGGQQDHSLRSQPRLHPFAAPEEKDSEDEGSREDERLVCRSDAPDVFGPPEQRAQLPSKFETSLTPSLQSDGS